MPREDLSKNLVMSFFPDLEHKLGEIFGEIERIGGSFERGNIKYKVRRKNGPTSSTGSVYRELIELYCQDCKVDVDEAEGIIDGLYVTCDNNKIFIMINLNDERLSVSAWVNE